MSLEGFSKRGMELGNDPEKIKETKNDLAKQYLNTIKRLAMQKMKNDLLFEGILGATIRRFSLLGLDISRESILKDIQEEIYRQELNFDLSNNYINQKMPVSANNNEQNIAQSTLVQNELEQLKNNLGNIFESPSVSELKPTTSSETIQNSQSYEQTSTFAVNLANLSDEIKQRIVKQIESRGEVIISRIDNIYQEENYIIVDAKDNQGYFTGAEFTLEEFSKIVNQPSISIKSEENSQSMEQPAKKEQSIENIISVQQTEDKSKQISNEESKTNLQVQQDQMKNQIINQIITGMNNAGELSFGDISMNERMSIIQNVQNKLNTKSMDELQILLSTYKGQNVQEESMHR